MAKKLSLALIFVALVPGGSFADVAGPAALVTPAQPQWSELTIEQRVILAPLSVDWDAMEFHRQKKWLGITRRFASMAPEEQRRIQAQMQAWGKLTPEQRRLARENFKTANKLPIEKKEALRQKWQEYSNLPPEEKEKLKEQAASVAARPRVSPPVTGSASPAIVSPVPGQNTPAATTPAPAVGVSPAPADSVELRTPVLSATEAGTATAADADSKR